MRGEGFFQVLAHGIKARVKKRQAFSQHVSTTTITTVGAGAVGPGEEDEDEGGGGRRHSQEERATNQDNLDQGVDFAASTPGQLRPVDGGTAP